MSGIPLRKIDQVVLSTSCGSWHGFRALCEPSGLGIGEEQFRSFWAGLTTQLDKGAQYLRENLPMCSKYDLQVLNCNLPLILRAFDSMLMCWKDFDPKLKAAVGDERAVAEIQDIKEKFEELFEDVSEALDPHFSLMIEEAISSIRSPSPAGHDWRKKISEL